MNNMKRYQKIIQQDSPRYITTNVNEGLSNQKLTNYEIKDYLVSCPVFTKYIYLDIFKNMNVIDKFNLLFRILNMNDYYNEV